MTFLRGGHPPFSFVFLLYRAEHIEAERVSADDYDPNAPSDSCAQEPNCDRGKCQFYNCKAPVNCKGGLCEFYRCHAPSCDGGLCVFYECDHPTCRGGACEFLDTKTPRALQGKTHCKGGRCLNDGVPMDSNPTEATRF